MDIARTFWEKATAAHVYCLQGNFRGGERYARHWFDLAAIANCEHFIRIQADRSVANAVAEHKGWFFREKAADQKVIDYGQAVNGNLQIVPEGAALSALEQDYSKMLDSGLLFNGAMSFEDVMTACARLESLVNGKAWEAPPEEVNWATSAPSLRA